MEGPFLVKSLWIKLWNCAKEGHVALRLCNTKYFDSMSTYKTFYKFIVRCLRCSSVALAIVLQTKIVDWLRARREPRAADWFEEYWTGERGNYMLAHAGVGGTNNNCGTEGGWNGVKKEVSAGSTLPGRPRTFLCVPSSHPSFAS